MLRVTMKLALVTSSLACVGYSDTSPAQDFSRGVESASDASVSPATEPVAPDEGAAAEAGPGRHEDEAAPAIADASAPHVPDLRIGHSPRFASYLMDDQGQPLYMFTGDIAGSGESACLDACAKDWPAFDRAELTSDEGIQRNELTRFHRQDGRWQSAYKGHPLYYRAVEAGTVEVGGDAVDGRWFVARDYLAFISCDRAPADSGSVTGFLTNGFGRTLYVCLDDTPAEGATPPVSSCLGECARRRPLWSASEAARTMILPSLMNPEELAAFVRADGAVQLTLHGWPLYYFSGDEKWGDTQGRNQDAWRAVDPTNIGRQVEP